MIKLSDKQIESVRRSGLLNTADAALTGDDLYNAVLDALGNDAPAVVEYTAEQDKGAYPVLIRGVPGAYYVSALEYDDVGCFDSLEDAEAEVGRHYGEFIISENDD